MRQAENAKQSNRTASNTVVGLGLPWVQIPPLPPFLMRSQLVVFLDFGASVIIRVVVKRKIKKLVTPTVKIEFIPSGKLSQYQFGFSRKILFIPSRVEK